MMYRSIVTLINASWIVLAVAGMAVSFIGYKQGARKTAFTLFIVYFAACLCAHTLSRPVMRWLAARHSHDISQEQLAQYEQMEQEMKALYLKYPTASPGTVVSYVNFPFGQTILVVGLWLMVRRKKES